MSGRVSEREVIKNEIVMKVNLNGKWDVQIWKLIWMDEHIKFLFIYFIIII